MLVADDAVNQSSALGWGSGVSATPRLVLLAVRSGGRRTHERDEEVVLEPPAGTPEDGVVPDLVFNRVPEGKAGKNRLHLDLRPQDQAAEVARLEGLGARRP